MTGYTRQSAASIIAGEVVRASPLNAEFNQIQAAFSESTGHAHDGSTGGGPRVARISDSVNKASIAVSSTSSEIDVSFSSGLTLAKFVETTTGTISLYATTGTTLTLGTTARPITAEIANANVSSGLTVSGLFTLSSAATATIRGTFTVVTGAHFNTITPTTASSGLTVANKTYVDNAVATVTTDAATAAAAAITAQNWASTAAVSAAAAAASAITAQNWATTAEASAVAAAASAALVESKISRSTAASTDGALVKFEGTTGSTVKSSTWVENSTAMVAGTNLNLGNFDIRDGGLTTSSARSFKGKVGTSWQQTDKGSVGGGGTTINEYDSPWIKITMTSSGVPITISAPSSGFGYSVLIKLVESTGGTFNPVFSKSTGTVLSWTPSEPTWASYTTATDFVLTSVLVDPDYDVTIAKVKDTL